MVYLSVHIRVWLYAIQMFICKTPCINFFFFFVCLTLDVIVHISVNGWKIRGGSGNHRKN